LLVAGLLAIASLGGCYIYTTEPPPQPVIIVPAQGTPAPAPQPQQQPAESDVPKAPVGAPAGEVGPPQS
jgi:hypothetical protein